jgi:hypothetical protein
MSRISKKGRFRRLLGKGKLIVALKSAVFYWLLTGAAYASGGGKPATKVLNVADTRSMSPGISKWIADIYNANLVAYGLTVVLTMAAMGAILGYGMDRLVRTFGIDLGRLEHRE